MLPGLAVATKRLADGSTRKYFYAWRGGPLLKDADGAPLQPGNPDFIVAYSKAHDDRKKPAVGTLQSLIAAFKSASEFTSKAERTRKDYMRYLDAIGAKFGTMSLPVLQDRRARGEFKAWRDAIAAASSADPKEERKPGALPHLSGERQADYAWGTLARVLAVAKDHGTISVNVCERGGRLYSVDRAEVVWLPEHVHAFNAVASEPLRFALLLALWTAQRQGDLIQLTWLQYDGSHIRLKQNKTGARVAVPVGAELKAALDARRPDNADGPILRNSRGEPWTADGFKTSWGKATTKAGLTGLRFHDLRGTAVTEMSLAGCTNYEIAAVTGHSEKEVDRIIKAYRGGRVELSDQAMAKRAARFAAKQIP
jgi:integrase